MTGCLFDIEEPFFRLIPSMSAQLLALRKFFSIPISAFSGLQCWLIVLTSEERLLELERLTEKASQTPAVDPPDATALDRSDTAR
jgi:hypothetical protein